MNFTEVDNNLQSLALELKNVCDSNGLEINPSKSAKVIHKIGLEHIKLSPDKISLIKSVGMLNSALARKPNNASDIENDLSNVCLYILKLAKASRQTANLVQHAKYVKSQIELMRAKIIQAMTEIKTENQKSKLKSKHENTMKSMKNIQQQITADYKQIMIDLCQYCVDVMGPPPCKFAVVGMGSLARKEITPYSDFEHIILLEILADYETHLDYFRWYSVVFHTVILNLQESIIPSLNVMYLNDKTCDLGDWFFDTYTSGISFDGMMPHACKFPLGRTQLTEKKPWATELIKPIDKMLEYLGSEESLKNGYHLSDILMVTCFVYGEQTLHDQFLTGIQSYKNSKTSAEIRDELRNQVKEDLDKFATRLRLVNLKPTKQLNIKQLFYRTSTLFIAALGKMCSIDLLSCFDIIDELAKQKKISKNARHKLSLAVAIGCKVRLGIYMKEKSQRDYIQPCNDANTIFDAILDIIDVDSIVSYFQITYCLQLEVIKMLGIKGIHIYSNVKMLNIAICYALKLDQVMLALCEKMFESNLLSGFGDDFSKFWNMYAKFFEDDGDLSEENSDSSDSSSMVSRRYGTLDLTDKHLEIEIKFSLFDKSIQDLEKRLKNVSKILALPDADLWIYDFSNFFAHVLFSLEVLKRVDAAEGLEFWRRYLDISQRWFQKQESKPKNNVVFFLFGIMPTFAANCLVELNRFDEASAHLNQFPSQPFFQKREINKFCNSIKNITENSNSDVFPDYVLFRHFMDGCIWFKMKNFEKSFHHLQISFGLLLSLDRSESILWIFRMSLSSDVVYINGIGSCLMEMKQYENALVYFKQAVKLVINDDDLHGFDHDSDDDDSDDDDYGENNANLESYMLPKIFRRSASFLNCSGCLLKMQKFDEAFVCLKRTLELLVDWKLENLLIKEFTSALKKKKLETLTNILYQFGLWCKQQNYFKEAVTYFQNSLCIHQRLNKANEISLTSAELLHCHMQMYQRERSEKFLKDLYHSNKFVGNVAIAPASNFAVDNALSYHFKVGQAFLKMKHYEKAIEFLKISLGITMSKEFIENEMHSIILYNSIGICLINLGEYEESLSYFNLSKEMLEKYNIDKKPEKEFWKSRLQIAISFHSVGKCFLKLDRFEETLPYLGVALDIFPTVFDNDNDTLVYLSTISVSHRKMFQEHQSLLFDIGFCNMKQNHYGIAQYHFEESLSIYKTLLKADEAITVATRLRLLTCHMEIYQRERIEKHLKDLCACNSIETTIRMVDIQTLTYSIQL